MNEIAPTYLNARSLSLTIVPEVYFFEEFVEGKIVLF